MSERDDADFLQDIQEVVRRVQAYIAEMTYGDFLADRKTQDADHPVIPSFRTCKRIVSPLRRSIRGGRGSQRSEAPGSNTFTSP